MRVRDFVEPATVLPERATLAEALPSLAGDIPVFVQVADVWHLVTPREVIGYPASRRLIDLPLAPAVCIAPETDIEVVLDGDAPVVGVEDGGRLIGSVARLGLLHEMATGADPATLGQLLQSRALPALLHDLSNSLAVAEMAVSSASLEPAAREAARVAIRHASALVTRIRALSAGDGDRPEPIDVAGVVEEMLPLLQLVSGPDISFSWMRHPETPWALGYRRLVERTVLNLVLNARDALGWRGRVAIAVGPAERGAERAVRLHVEDDGPGVPAALASRIFESGVSTKRGAARGLGLASVRRALARVGGTISLGESQLGGAAFDVLLPAAGR